VDNELVGDPLDLKMFEFTQWSYEEGHQGGANADDEEQGALQPSIARPPLTAKNENNSDGDDRSVSDKPNPVARDTDTGFRVHLSWASSSHLSLCPSFAAQASSSERSGSKAVTSLSRERLSA
jgi:hypothetical protein